MDKCLAGGGGGGGEGGRDRRRRRLNRGEATKYILSTIEKEEKERKGREASKVLNNGTAAAAKALTFGTLKEQSRAEQRIGGRRKKERRRREVQSQSATTTTTCHRPPPPPPPPPRAKHGLNTNYHPPTHPLTHKLFTTTRYYTALHYACVCVCIQGKEQHKKGRNERHTQHNDDEGDGRRVEGRVGGVLW